MSGTHAETRKLLQNAENWFLGLIQDAIFTAIDRQGRNHRDFVDGTEQHLSRLYPKLLKAVAVAHVHRQKCPGFDMDSLVERAIPDLRERSVERVRKAMAKLTGLMDAEEDE